MTDPVVAAVLIAVGLPVGFGGIVAIETIVARLMSRPSRLERNAIVWARAMVYELKTMFRELIREEINEALDERERRRRP